jgi:hypothetical protein
MLRLLLKLLIIIHSFIDVKAENLILDHLSHIEIVYFLISIRVIIIFFILF